jgi:hypothetical protein
VYVRNEGIPFPLFEMHVCNEHLMRRWPCGITTSHRIQATWNLLEPPSESISLVIGGVVLPGNTYGEDSARGKDVAIVIATLTHYPLEPSCINTHTHTPATSNAGWNAGCDCGQMATMMPSCRTS